MFEEILFLLEFTDVLIFIALILLFISFTFLFFKVGGD